MGLFVPLLFGSKGGLRYETLRKMTVRNKFSDYLPYAAYAPETGAYLNMDDSIGFVWECTPLVYANIDTFDVLRGLFAAAIPVDSVLQFIMYADSYIKPILDRHSKLMGRDIEVVRDTVKNRYDFFKTGSKTGLSNLQGVPVRNFRLIVSLKMPSSKELNVCDIRDTVCEILRGARLFPENMLPENLIYFLMRLLNDRPPAKTRYDENVPIRKQIVLSQTKIKAAWNHMEVGAKQFRCMSPKVMPEQVNGLLFNYLTGDIWGPQSDTSQIKQPFLMVTNLIFESLKAKLHAKCNLVLQQQAVGSFAASLKRRQEEYSWATGEVEKGTPFVRVMPLVWCMGDSEQDVRESVARIRRLWESRGFTMQEDKGITNILFISSLPLGLYNIKDNVSDIDRDFICDAKSASFCLPIQADFRGGQDACNLFIGRKGQLTTIDVFDSRGNNMNALIAAETGSGKSFFTNYMVFNYFSTGAIVRLIDIGGSYRKLCKMLGGVFIEFSRDSGIVINPFSNVVDIGEDASAITAIIAQMVFSSTNAIPSETEKTIIGNAINYAYENYGPEADIDRVYEYLTSFPKYADEVLDINCDGDTSCMAELRMLASRLGFNLRDFTSQGQYGRWFNGPSTLDITHDEFVVLELEELKKQRELFRVITLQVLNYVTQDLYLSNRSRKRLIVFDEAWQFFKEGDMLKNIIEEGYRRARKYGGSFTTITQSLLDLEMFGSVGDVIRDNSAYKFYLESSSFEKAKNKKIVDYDDFTMSLLKSVKSPRPRYSEVFMDTPVGQGIGRLVVDPFSYYLFTSDAGENAEIERRVRTGKSYAEVISELVYERERK